MAINKTINKSTKSHGAMKNCINYVLKEKKVEDNLIFMTGPSPEELTPDNVYDAFMDEKRIWDKDEGRMYNHNIISFAPEEDISPEDALDFGKDFAEEWFPEHQSLISVHQDKEHTHIHVVTNTVSFMNGMKLHNSRAELQEMKDFTNELCEERGYSISEKGRHFGGDKFEPGEIIAWKKDKYQLFTNGNKESYVVDCAMAVMKAKEASASREEFELSLENQGWYVNWEDDKENITFESDKGNKVKDSNLSNSFSLDVNKEALQREFERQNLLRLARREKEEERRKQEERELEELEQYYAEVEAAIQADGIVGETIGGVENNHESEGYAAERGSSEGPVSDTGAFVRNIRSEISDIRTTDRTIRSAEDKSNAPIKQRQIEKQPESGKRIKHSRRKDRSHSEIER